MATAIVHDQCACAYCGGLFDKPVTSPPTNIKFCSAACRFWAKVDKSGGQSACWNWAAKARGQSGTGYGIFLFQGRATHAHRVAWELTHGPIPDGLFGCHKCDNPLCCNPSHLFLGTHRDNMADMHAKGRNTMSPDGLERLKASKRGKARSPEVRAKLSAALRGRTIPPDIVEKAAATQRGKRRSEETKAKMRAAWELRKLKANAGVYLQAR